MPVPMTLSTATDLIDVSIQRIYKKSTNLSVPGDVMKLYHEETTNDYYDKDSSVSGFGEAARLVENAIITSESPVQGFDKTYTQVFHGKMAQFTLQEWKFGIKKRKLEGVVSDLTRTAGRKKERLLTEYLENSINDATTYTVLDDSGNWTKTVTGGDGVGFIDAAHTREDGGAAWSNVIGDGTTSNMDFETDALKALWRTGSLIRDPKGNLMDINYDTTVFRKGSPISFRAMEINGALKKNMVPGSAENDGAPFGVFNTLVLPYLSTDAAAYWWGFDMSMKGPEIGLQVRKSQDTVLDKPYADYKTKTVYVSATFAMDYGHNDGRNAAGSLGINA